jgi:hypothetical protein
MQNNTGLYSYENGVQIATQAGFITADASESLRLCNGQGFFSNSTIDELGFWNRSLSVAEIQTLYNNGNGYNGTSIQQASGIQNTTLYIFNTTGWAMNNSWGKRITINLDNYPNQINMTYLTGMNNDFSDVRFFSGSCHIAYQPLQYKLSSVTSGVSSIIWIANVSSNKQICMYYDNPFATDGQNASLIVGNSSLTTYTLGQVESGTGVADNLVNQTIITSFTDIFNTIISLPVALTDGIYKWFITAYDYAGNYIFSSNQTISIDTTKPGINFVSPTNPSGTKTNGGLPVNISIIDANPTNISIYLYNSSNSPCYQETANSSTGVDGSCMQSYTGNYTCPGGFCNWGNFSAIIDGDWDTYDASTGTVSRMIVNYTKPLLAVGASLQIKTGVNYTNISVPSNCWNADTSKVSVMIYSDTNGIYETFAGCWNGVDYTTNQLYYVTDLSNSSYGDLYEEAIIWNISTLINTTINYNNNNLYINFTLPNGIYYYRADSYDYAGWSNLTEVRNATVDIPPYVAWQNQSPMDLTSNNTFNTGMNITYVINATSGSLDPSTITMYYMTNRTQSPYSIFINGTGYGGWSPRTYSSNIGDVYMFRLFDNQIYPATYNWNETLMETTIHSSQVLNNNSEWAKIELLNFTGTDTYNQFEIMANATSNSSGSAQLYYCNSTYSSGDPGFDNSCSLLGTISPTEPYGHCHGPSEYSCHTIVPVVVIPFNITGGLVNNQTVVTSPSNFLFSGGTNGSWNVYYINNFTRTTAASSSIDNGAIWTNQNWIYDAHMHIYDGADYLLYYVNASTIYGGTTRSTTIQDLIDYGGLPPSPPSVNTPAPGYYRQNLTITYDQSFGSGGANISYYNISLLNIDENFNQTIVGNNGLNLSYVWNTLTVPDSGYIIRVTVIDQNNLTSSSLSEIFYVDNDYPEIVFNSGTTQNGSYIITPVTYNVTADDLYLTNITVYLYNWLNNLVNSSTTTYGLGNITATVTGSFPFPLDGIYYINSTTCDIAGNCNSTETRTVIYDTTNPIVTYTTPTTSAGGPYSLTAIWVNATATDTNLNNITVNLTLSYGGTPYSNQQVLTGISTTSASLFYNWTGLGQGVYNLTAWAYDKAGLIGYAENRSINIDTEAPTMNYTSPTPSDGEHIAKTYYTINVTADDPNFVSQTIYYWQEGGAVQTQTVAVKTNTLLQQNLSDGVYYFNASAIDGASRVGWLPTRNVTIEYRNQNVSVCKELFIEGGNYVVLTDLVATNGTCLNITADNIDLTCQNHVINGNGWDAIAVASGVTGVTIRNCTALAAGKIALKVGESPASVTVYDSTFWNSDYGIYVAPEANLYSYNNTISSNIYGIYFNYSNNGNILSNTDFSLNTEDALTFINSSGNYIYDTTLTALTDTSDNGVIRFITSVDNNFTQGVFTSSTTKLFAAYNYSINNYLYSCTYTTSQDYVDGTSQLIRAWPFTGYVIDNVRSKIGGASILYTASSPTNQNVSYINGVNITYGTLSGITYTNDVGIANAAIIEYMNIFGTQYDSSPYYMNASYLRMAPTNALVTVQNATYHQFILNQEWKSTSLSRTAMWIILGIIFLIGIAASIGFFMVRMREGYSVVDIWKYFIILVIWLTIFTIIYFVLAWFIMGSFYPQV